MKYLVVWKILESWNCIICYRLQAFESTFLKGIPALTGLREFTLRFTLIKHGQHENYMTSSFNWLLGNITCCLYKTLCTQNLGRDERFHLFYFQVWLLSENPGVPCFHLSQHSASPWCWTKPPGDSVTLICLFVSLSVCLFVCLSQHSRFPWCLS